MPLLTWTTTIKIEKPVASKPFMEPSESWTVIASGVHAHIDPASAVETDNQRLEQTYVIYCDVVDGDIPQTARVTDEGTGKVYKLNYAHKYNLADNPIFGFLSHVEIGATVVTGSVPA